MTEATSDIRMRLDQVRHRWRRLEMVKALSVGVVEAAGLLMVFMLADWLYRFSPAVRTALLAAGVTAVVAVLLRHVVAAFARQITDEELALFVEKRNPELQGALLSATEFGEHRGTPLHNYIVDVLVGEARRRIQVVDVRRTVDLSRLAKYGIACLVMLGVFVLTGALFPQFIWRQGERVLVPWRPQPEDAGTGAYRPDDLLDPNNLKAPIRFGIIPGNVEVLEGAAVEVIAQLSRDTLGLDPTLFIKSERSDWERIPMKSIERIFTYTAAIEDISRSLEYYVAVGNDESERYRITVRRRLKVLGLEMTTEFPAYLRRPPVTMPAYTGDIATLEGSRVTVNVKTNQPVTEGRVTLGSGREIPLALTEAGGKATLDVTADDTWRYVVKNRAGEEAASERLFFIQALPDRPPTMDVMEPNNDMTVHPLSEVTCVLQVSEDWALDAVRMKLEVIRQGANKVPERKSETRDFLPETWTGRVDQGAATMVLPLEALTPKLNPGDSIFYHFEVTDRKGQSTASDLFFISVAEPEVFVYYGTLDWHAPDEKIPISPLMQFIAAAWQLELQRKELPADELLAKCRQLAEKMLDPESGRLIDFIRLGARGDGKGPILPDSDPRKKVAADHTQAGYDFLRSGEPGKAVVEFKIVWAILKQFFGDASIMLASADMRNPNAVVLEEGETFARVEQFSKMDMRELDRELQQLADQQVDWRRKLGRKELEKVEETRKEIAELKKDVQQLADDAREGKTEPKETTEPGETEPGEQEKPGEKKPGEEKPGEEKPGEEKPGEQKPGEEKPGEQRPGETGDERREDRRRGASLADRARRDAERAEELARNLQDVIEGREDEEVRKGLGNLRDAAAELERAARDIEGERLDIAETRAKTAHRFLDRAEQDLSDVKFGRLNEMMAAAIAQGHRLSERQKKISDTTGELEKKSDEIAKDRKRGDPRAGVEEQALREKTKTLSEAQAALSEQAEVFKKFVERMHEVSRKTGEEHVARLLDEGVKEMQRRDLPQKMVDAAVDIRQGDLKRAKKPQEQAAGTIRTVVDALYRASDALSGTKEGALERVASRAREVKKKGLDLAGMKEKDLAARELKPDETPKPGEEEPGEGKNDEKQPGERKPGEEKDDTKGDAEKKDDDARAAGKEGDRKPPGKEDDTKAERQEGDEKAELSRRRRRQEAEKLWSEVRTLAVDLRQMDVVPKRVTEELSKLSEDDFRGMFDGREERKMKRFIELVAATSKLLDEKLLEAETRKKLESGLRDECPPSYRRLVGRYYSVLSEGE